MMRKRNIGRRVICVMFFTSLLFSSVSLFAQAPKGGRTASNRPPAAGAKCTGAWTGSVTYARIQSMTNDKTTPRVSARGEDKTSFQLKYEYKADVAVTEDPSKNGSSNGKATVSMVSTANEVTTATEKNSCDRGKTWKDMKGEFTSKSKTSGSAKTEANVTVGINDDGTYSVSIGVPQIKGETSGEQTSSYSGQCTPKEGKTLTLPPTPTTIEGNSLTSDGSNRVDPKDPNKLSGSYSRTWQNVTETITWNLEKCGAPLRITDLKFEDMKFPNWNDWQAISEQKGTIDGNLVKITAKILNTSGETKEAEIAFKETFKGDKWDGARPDSPLKNHLDYINVRVGPNEDREVEMLWDTSGFAWYDDGRPRLVQRVKAEVWEKSKLVDDETKNIKIAPKPLVLVHGLWSNWKAWESWQNILTTSHSYDWKAFPVGEKPEKGVMNTGGSFLSTQPTASIAENARQLESYIKYAQEDRNAWHVDIVAHSMGGLISRYYISQIMPQPSEGDFRPKVSRLIMLGTPNMGSPCADVMNVAFEALGQNVEAVRQLRQDYVEGFNRINVARKGVKFSVLAGNPLPTMCKTIVWNDGVVPVPSAKWKIKDNAESKSVHTDLTGTSDFSTFVKPRLAIGPHGDHNPEAPDPSQFTGRYGTGRVYGASELAFETLPEAAPETSVAAPFARSLKLAPKQTIEIEIPVETAQNFGITFMADSNISATLVNSDGVLIAKNEARSPESRGWFRSLFYDKPTTPGIWKLRLENTAETENQVIATAWNNAR